MNKTAKYNVFEVVEDPFIEGAVVNVYLCGFKTMPEALGLVAERGENHTDRVYKTELQWTTNSWKKSINNGRKRCLKL